jgi:hypothetical protein
MILEIVKTYVDQDDADVDTFDVELTADELVDIRRWAPGTAEWNDEEWVEFRGVRYEYPEDICDILQTVGKRIAPDETIEVYVY